MALRKREGKPTIQQVLTRKSLADALANKAEAKRKGRDLGFKERLNLAAAPAVSDIADVMSEHPVRGAMMAAPVGVGFGMGALSLLKQLK